MHAVMVTFTTAAPLEEVGEELSAHARTLARAAGLLQSVWVAEGETVGGFHVFEDRRCADAYLSGPLFGAISTNASFSDFGLRHFDVLLASTIADVRAPCATPRTGRAP
jgi:hypothetical protein